MARHGLKGNNGRISAPSRPIQVTNMSLEFTFAIVFGNYLVGRLLSRCKFCKIPGIFSRK